MPSRFKRLPIAGGEFKTVPKSKSRPKAALCLL
jgi:hypothetical protein